MVNVGTSIKPIYILAEFCALLPGQPIKSKLMGNESDAMIKFACRAPAENAQSITTSARELLHLDNNPQLVSLANPSVCVCVHACVLTNGLQKAFEINVDKSLITVRGRELPPPSVGYMKGTTLQPITPDNGQWLMKGVKICQPGRRIATWTYLTIGGGSSAVKSSVVGFAKFLNGNMGIPMGAQPSPPGGHESPDRNEEALRNAFKKIASQKPRPDLVLITLPDKDATRYNIVKRLGDVEFGLTTVCVRQAMLVQEKGQLGYFANVGLKVNLKFGGVNHKVKDETKLVADTMFVGYDVTHPTNLPSGAGDNAPSIVGLVASVDSNLAQWPAVAWEHKSRVEEVSDKDGTFIQHFKDRLRLWQSHNAGKLPPNIVIFRDGVSEGQFKMVLDKELPNIRTACLETYPGGPNAQPRVSLIVSVKRHQTRFYPTDPNHIHPRSKSPKEGTVVDRGVTNVRYWDFFLQAHASLQGESIFRFLPSIPQKLPSRT